MNKNIARTLVGWAVGLFLLGGSATASAQAVNAPVVTPNSTSEGASTAFSVSGTFTDPGGAAGAPFTVVVNWGDGTTDTGTWSNASNPFNYFLATSHTYAQSGTYSVAVSVTNTSSNTGVSTATSVSVANVAPIVSTPIVAPTTANAGVSTSFTVSGIFSDAADALDQPFTAVVDWGDGVTDTATVSGAANPFGYTFNGNHTFAVGGNYNVTVSVTDKDGGTGTSASSSVAVAGPPVVPAPTVNPTTASEGASTAFSVSGTFTDPLGAAGLPFTVVVNWGDGVTQTTPASGAANPFSYALAASHTYAQSGTYSVTVSVTNTNSLTGNSAATAVSVANVAPAVSTPIVAPTTASTSVSASFTVSGTFTDPAGALDQPFTAVVNWGDGVTNTATVSGAANPFGYSFSGNHTYAAAGNYNVTVSVTDKDSGTGTSAATSVAVTGAGTTFSGPSATGTGTITAVLTGGGPTCVFSSPQFIGPPPGAPPIPPTSPASSIVFPQGLFNFSTTGCTIGSTITLAITYPNAIVGARYWKYGPEAANPSPHWYVMPASIVGNTATFSITDGGKGDDNLALDGVIADPGGPGFGGDAVPTLSEWMLALLAFAMLGLAVHHQARRRR